VIAGTPGERTQKRAMDCGFAAQGDGGNLLSDAEAKGDAIKAAGGRRCARAPSLCGRADLCLLDPRLHLGLTMCRDPGTLNAEMEPIPLVRNRALDYGRVVTCGCPVVRALRAAG